MATDGCRRCGLWRTRHCVVRTRGPETGRILIVGEGPGQSEDLLGLPFVGPSGRLLNEMVAEAGIRPSDVIFTNCVWCRPTDSTTGENREPTREEMEMCWPNLRGVLYATRPVVVVAAGQVAARWLKHWKVAPLLTIIHPAAVLRAGGKASTQYLHNVRILDDARVIAAKEKQDERPENLREAHGNSRSV